MCECFEFTKVMNIPYLPVDEIEEVLGISVGSGSNDNEADDVVVDVAVDRDGDRNLKQANIQSMVILLVPPKYEIILIC